MAQRRLSAGRMHRAVVEALTREAPALVINTGDLTDVGSEESNWQRYFDITAPLGSALCREHCRGDYGFAHNGLGVLAADWCNAYGVADWRTGGCHCPGNDAEGAVCALWLCGTDGAIRCREL